MSPHKQEGSYTNIPILAIISCLRHCIKYVSKPDNLSTEPADDLQMQLIFGLVKSAFEVLTHLGSYDPPARRMLRSLGTIDICLSIIEAIRDSVAQLYHQVLGTEALASAVSTLRLVSIAADQVEADSLHAIPVIYDVLRSQLSQPRIQQEGLQLLYVLCRRSAGANKLDDVVGSWQWLGCTQFHAPLSWTVASYPDASTKKTNWNASCLASFLGIRGLRQERCSELQCNFKNIVLMALLPFEGETVGAWLVRVGDFETRNCVCMLDVIRV